MAAYILNVKGLNMGNTIDFTKESVQGNTIDFVGAPSKEPSLVQKPQGVSANAYSIVSDKIGVEQSTWDTFRDEIAKIESAGSGDYAAKGGHNNHYDGRYQMGKVAKTDASTLLGYSLLHDTKSREAFRDDRTKQEEAFAAFTSKNHSYLMNKSKKYRGLSLNEKLSALAYAHNQGWSKAKKWLQTGEVGADSAGTKGTKYSNAIQEALK